MRSSNSALLPRPEKVQLVRQAPNANVGVKIGGTMNVIVRSLTVAGVMLAATVVETPTVSAQTFCGNVRDFPRSVRVVVFGLTNGQRLVRFRECRPDNARDIGAITGLEPDDAAIVAIDFRV